MALSLTAQPEVLPPAVPFLISQLPVSVIHYDGDCYVAASDRMYLLNQAQLGRTCSVFNALKTLPQPENGLDPLAFTHNGLPVAVLDDDPQTLLAVAVSALRTSTCT